LNTGHLRALQNQKCLTDRALPFAQGQDKREIFAIKSKRPAALAVALLAMLVTARGQIFVSVNNGFNGLSAVGEYNLNGTPVNTSLITGLNVPSGIVVSGGNLFVANAGSGTIGEYTTSGATVNASLLTVDANDDNQLAASGSELFVTIRNSGDGGGGVAEYTLGNTPGTVSSSDPSFITGLYEPTGIAVEFVPKLSTWTLLAGGLLALISVTIKRRRA
jgi:hypothetical protein